MVSKAFLRSIYTTPIGGRYLPLLTYKLFTRCTGQAIGGMDSDNILIHIPPEILKTQCELGSSYERLTR